MTEYIIREDGQPRSFSGNDDSEVINIKEILNDYPYLVESMNKEDYVLNEDVCFYFDEILHENKVVGFTAMDLYDMEVMRLTDCYILPEFRGKGLFYIEISKLNYIAPAFGIIQPTRKIIELLIKYSYAEMTDNNIVVSAIDLYFNKENTKSNKKDRIYDEVPHSNFYDLKNCSTVLVYNGEVIYHDQLKDDLINYGERKKLTKHYFKSVKKQLRKSKNEYALLIEILRENFPSDKLTFEEFVGEDEGLSEFLQLMVDNNIVSHDRALEIKQQIINEYESGLIDDETLDDRVNALLVDEMNEEIDFDDFYEDELDVFNLLLDNEEYGDEILKAVIEDDKEKFRELMEKAMASDDNFSNNVYKFSEEMDDEPNIDVYGDERGLESLGLNLNSRYPVADMMWGADDGKYKLDNTFYGKDYPMSHDNHIYNVLKSLKKHNNLKLAMDSQEMSGSMTSHAVESLLFQMGLIKESVNYDNWDEFAHNSLTVNDLKDILRENNLKVSGKKQELIDRISENNIPLNNLKSSQVTVTEEGEEFLEENQWIDVYNTVLPKFNFNDYYKYLDEHEGEILNLTSNYINKHLNSARKQNNKQYVHDCIIAKNKLSKYRD